MGWTLFHLALAIFAALVTLTALVNSIRRAGAGWVLINASLSACDLTATIYYVVQLCKL